MVDIGGGNLTEAAEEMAEVLEEIAERCRKMEITTLALVWVGAETYGTILRLLPRGADLSDLDTLYATMHRLAGQVLDIRDEVTDEVEPAS